MQQVGGSLSHLFPPFFILQGQWVLRREAGVPHGPHRARAGRGMQGPTPHWDPSTDSSCASTVVLGKPALYHTLKAAAI